MELLFTFASVGFGALDFNGESSLAGGGCNVAFAFSFALYWYFRERSIAVKEKKVNYHPMSLLRWCHGIDRYVLQIFTCSRFLDMSHMLRTDLVQDSLKLHCSSSLAMIGSNGLNVVWFVSLSDDNFHYFECKPCC